MLEESLQSDALASTKHITIGNEEEIVDLPVEHDVPSTGLSRARKKYEYNGLLPIGWIRVLEILPGAGPLRCRLRTEELKNLHTNFDALSYVWGSDVKVNCANLICNDQNVTIGANLACALERIRDHSKSKMIWVDAVCINQEDIEECSQQVQQMAEIYTTAQKVLIWIGDGCHKEADSCFHLIEKVNVLSRQLRTRHGAVENIPAGAYDVELSAIPREAWASVGHLMKASWFTRVWTIQEVGLARSASVLYGSAEMDWTELVEFVMSVSDRPDLAAYASDINAGMIWDVFESIWLTFANVESWRNSVSYYTITLAETSQRQNFIDLVNVTRPYNATDSRDRVYALLGHPTALHASAGAAKILEVDYNKNVTEVYTDLAAYTLIHDQFPWTALSSIDHTEEAPALQGRRPSWVPWWDEGWRTYWLGYSTMWYRAGGLNPDRFKAEILSGSILRIKAIVFDHVVWASDHMTAATVMSQRYPRADPIEKLWDTLEEYDGHSRYGDSEQREAAFSLVTVAGRARDESAADRDMVLHAMTYNSTKTSRSTDHASDTGNVLQPTEFSDLHSRTFIRNQARALHNRRLFRTFAGYYGICHFSMEVGDYCVVFPGANVPFVLRQTPQDTARPASQISYYLIGEAYVQGVMRGELLEDVPEIHPVLGQVSEQDILIK